MLMTLHWLRQVGQVYVGLSMFVNNLHFDITLNGTKSQLMFLKVDFVMFLLVAFRYNVPVIHIRFNR